VAGENLPLLTPGQPVKVEDLEAIPWVKSNNNTNSVQVAFRATSVTLLNVSKVPVSS
jgi:hypothetical protein